MTGRFVAKKIELQYQWRNWYAHLYYPCGGGQPVIDDDEFDLRFRHFEPNAGCNCVETGPPPLPDRALEPSDVELYGLEIYDVLTEFRRLRDAHE